MWRLLQRFETNRPFTEHEAWLLFRLAAYSEAVGWTLLIAGIALKRYVLHGNNLPVLITGQFHGTLFIIYLVAAIGLYPSLGWSRLKSFVAILASAPPYGSLLFEQWAAHKRRHEQVHMFRSLVVYRTIVST